MLNHINSIRAISVILIIFYHLNLKNFAFGFLGVDIFLVISGFLIAKILAEEIIITKKINIFYFFLRRARRLFPIIFFVLLVSILISYFLTYDDKIFISNSVIYNILLIPNIFFWINDVNYFSEHLINANFLKHTWSLGIEYQFYIFFPFFLIIFKKNLKKFIYVFIIFSFLLDFYFIDIKPSASFYLIPTRLWEFLIGSIFYIEKKKYLKLLEKIKYIDIISIILIFIIIFFLIELNLIYKKFFVVFFSAIVILCYKKNNFYSFLLDNRILNYIGIISFSLYLWHYLIFKLNEYFFFHLNIFQLVFLTFLLSTLSYHLIEKPFRNNNLYSGKIITSVLFFIIISTFFAKSTYYGIYKYDKEFLKSFEVSKRFEKCIDIDFDLSNPNNQCFLGNKNIDRIDFILLGDSIAYSLAQGFDTFANERNTRGIVLTKSSCPPLSGVNFIRSESKDFRDRKYNCENFNKEIIEFIFVNSIKNVYIIANWETYLTAPILDDKIFFLNDKSFFMSVEDKRFLLLKKGLEDTQKKLNSINVNITIFNQLPVLKFQDAKKIAYKEIQLAEKIKNYNLGPEINKYFLSKSEFILYKSKTEKMIKEIFSKNQIIDLTNFFCDEYCLTTKNKKSLYNDNIHFSEHGAIFFSNILNKVK